MKQDDLIAENDDSMLVYASTAPSEKKIPQWWKTTFLASFLLMPVYFFYLHNGVKGRSTFDSYDRAMAKHMEAQLEAMGEISMDEKGIRRFLDDPSWLTVGKSIYKSNCVACHAADGGGLVGPNLCDDSYKNIRGLGGFIGVLQNGAGGGAMPPWKNKLQDSEIVLVSAYVASLRGSSPASPKAAEGKAIPAW